nr:MAG TPA: bifunctional riboflavin kinase/FMN adenylyltransferase [Caudoviricetes sp.]
MNNNNSISRRAVALGDFDGMHKAHQTVITGAENNE